MLNIIKTGFELTNRYLILATPLILFSLISSLYLVFSVTGNGNILNLIFAAVLFVLMFGAFFSGWFYMLKQCVLDPEKEDVNSLIKEFPAGVGEYFLPILGMIAISVVLGIIMLTASYYVGMKFIGDLGISAEALTKSAESMEALQSFMTSLSKEQILKLNLWNLVIFSMMSLTTFILMLFPQSLMFKYKNPLKAFVEGLKCLFGKKFFANAGLFLLVLISYILLSVLTTVFSVNVVFHFVFTLVNFYYTIFVAVLLFNYYYQNFVRFDKTV